MLLTTNNPIPGKLCLVTGGTSGIGSAAALQLARLGATVVLVGRTVSRCMSQVERIQCTVPDAQVYFLCADLSSQQEVRRLAAEFVDRYSHLDVLVNNAGAIFERRTLSVDGLEMTFALNHMSSFLLTNLLLGRLKASTSARIVMVSSAAHEQGKIRFDDLQFELCYDRLAAYAQSKLANLLFMNALTRRLIGTRVTVNALHPGLVATNLGSNNSWLRVRLRNLVKQGMISPEAGAKTLVYLCVSPDVEGITGQYFNGCKAVHSSDESYDAAIAEKLWQESEALVGLCLDLDRVYMRG